MTKKSYLAIIMLLWSALLVAQNGVLTGVVLDSKNKKPHALCCYSNTKHKQRNCYR